MSQNRGKQFENVIREAFEKLSETLDGNATAAENVYVKSDYTIAVCSYAEAMIQKEEV